MQHASMDIDYMGQRWPDTYRDFYVGKGILLPHREVTQYSFLIYNFMSVKVRNIRSGL